MPQRIETPKLDKFVTCVGLSHYAIVREPSTRFKEEGEYSIKLEVPKNEALALRRTLKDHLDDNEAEVQKSAGRKQAMKRSVHFPVYKEDDKFFIKAVNRGSWKDKNDEVHEINIPVYDSKTDIIPKKVLIGNGSKCRLSVVPELYFVGGTGYGIRLKLMGLQVLELVKYTAGADQSASGLGFGEEEGFAYDEEDFADMPEETSEGDPDSGDEGGEDWEEEEEAPKKKRGRPAGSKNKPKKEPEPEEEEEEGDSEEEEEPEPPKKKRGRPAGSKNKSKKEPEPDPEEEDEDDWDEDSDEEEDSEDDWDEEDFE